MCVPIDWKEFALLTTFKLPEMANLVFLSFTELALVKYADKVVGRVSWFRSQSRAAVL